MAKKTRVQDYDQFQLRLPPGMRERIKAKADRAGSSMNEAIVWCLHQYFPAPKTYTEAIEELAEMVAMLKADVTQENVTNLSDEIHNVIVDIVNDKIKAPFDFKKLVSDRYERWEEDEQERLGGLHDNPYDIADAEHGGAQAFADRETSSPDYDPFTTDPLPKPDEKP